MSYLQSFIPFPCITKWMNGDCASFNAAKGNKSTLLYWLEKFITLCVLYKSDLFARKRERETETSAEPQNTIKSMKYLFQSIKQRETQQLQPAKLFRYNFYIKIVRVCISKRSLLFCLRDTIYCLDLWMFERINSNRMWLHPIERAVRNVREWVWEQMREERRRHGGMDDDHYRIRSNLYKVSIISLLTAQQRRKIKRSLTRARTHTLQ